IHPVIAQRQVVGQHEARFADPAAVQVERWGEIVALPYPGANSPVFKRHPHLGRLSVGYVHPERGLLTGLVQDGLPKSAGPVRAFVRSPRRVAFRLVSGGDAERCQHCNQGAFRDANSATAPIVVLSGDPESSRKFDQRRRQSAHTDILLVEMSWMRPECSPRRRLFCELGLLRAVRCATTISTISSP